MNNGPPKVHALLPEAAGVAFRDLGPEMGDQAGLSEGVLLGAVEVAVTESLRRGGLQGTQVYLGLEAQAPGCSISSGSSASLVLLQFMVESKRHGPARKRQSLQGGLALYPPIPIHKTTCRTKAESLSTACHLLTVPSPNTTPVAIRLQHTSGRGKMAAPRQTPSNSTQTRLPAFEDGQRGQHQGTRVASEARDGEEAVPPSSPAHGTVSPGLPVTLSTSDLLNPEMMHVCYSEPLCLYGNGKQVQVGWTLYFSKRVAQAGV